MGRGEIARVVALTERYWHRLGMPRHRIAIESTGEYVYALDLAADNMIDCPIVTWSGYDPDGAIAEADSLYAFLRTHWEDAKEGDTYTVSF